MIFISDKMYTEIADKLLSELKKSQGFFNGKIEYDTEEFYSTLTCSLVIYYRPENPAEIEKVVPVWWNFTACAGNTLRPNDFSWSEFISFLPFHA